MTILHFVVVSLELGQDGQIGGNAVVKECPSSWNVNYIGQLWGPDCCIGWDVGQLRVVRTTQDARSRDPPAAPHISGISWKNRIRNDYIREKPWSQRLAGYGFPREGENSWHDTLNTWITIKTLLSVRPFFAQPQTKSELVSFISRSVDYF